MRKLVLLFPLLVASCGSRSGTAPVVANEPLRLELASPDLAVKSWWKVRDRKNAETFADCQANAAREKSISQKSLQEVATGAALADIHYRATEPCQLTQLTRDIVEVKVESDTRAVVLAKLKDSTPVPAGATPDESALKHRQEGFSYKYVVEKIGKEWKIAQVYTFEPYLSNTEPWRPVYSENPKPHVGSYLIGDE